MEELIENLLQEVVLEETLQHYLENLIHCDKLEQCMTAFLHKIPSLLWK